MKANRKRRYRMRRRVEHATRRYLQALFLYYKRNEFGVRDAQNSSNLNKASDHFCDAISNTRFDFMRRMSESELRVQLWKGL